jgi:hypothetical protein
VLAQELLHAQRLVGQAGDISDGFVLASRLQAARPAFAYVAVAQQSIEPSERNVVNVYANHGVVVLTARTSDGVLLHGRWPAR